MVDEIFLTLAIENLRQCLTDPKKPIPAFFVTRKATTLSGLGPDYPYNPDARTSHQNPESQPNSNPKES